MNTEVKKSKGRPALVNKLHKTTVSDCLDDVRVRLDVLSNHIANNWGKADLIYRKVNTLIGKIDGIMMDLNGPTLLSDADLKKIRGMELSRMIDNAAAEAGLGEYKQSRLAEMKFFLEDYLNNKE